MKDQYIICLFICFLIPALSGCSEANSDKKRGSVDFSVIETMVDPTVVYDPSIGLQEISRRVEIVSSQNALDSLIASTNYHIDGGISQAAIDFTSAQAVLLWLGGFSQYGGFSSMLIQDVSDFTDYVRIKVLLSLVKNSESCDLTSGSTPLYLITVESQKSIVFEETVSVSECE